MSSDELFNTQDMTRDLAGRSARGGFVTMSSRSVLFVLQMASTMILARLLTPSDFGLVGMVTVVITLATVFKSAGLAMATVQKEQISQEQISTLFWLNLIISAITCLAVLASAPLVARFYGKPELTSVTIALSFSFILSGLTIQHQALQQRHMRFGTIAGIQIVSRIITLIVTVILAFVGWRYWALIIGTLTYALTNSILTFCFCPWKPGSIKRGTGVRGMLKFGGHLTGFNFINYFSRNADNILIGRFIGADALGLYSKAYRLFMLPIGQIREPLNQVFMPVLSSLQNKPDRYIKYYQRLLDVLAALTMPMTLYVLLEADFLIRIILGNQWLDTIPVFRILAVAGLMQAIASTRGLVLVSFGFTKRYFYWGLVNAVVTVTSFILGIPYGIQGVAISYTIATYVILVPSLFYCFHDTPIKVSLFFSTLLPTLAISGLAGLAVITIKRFVLTDSNWSHGIVLIVFLLVYVGLSLRRKSIHDTLRIILKGSVIKPVSRNEEN